MLILYGDNLLSTDQIIEAPDWDDDGTYDIKRDLGKTMVQRLFHWGPLAVICITLIVCSIHHFFNNS